MASLSAAAGAADKIVLCGFNENQLICSLEGKKYKKKKKKNPGGCCSFPWQALSFLSQGDPKKKKLRIIFASSVRKVSEMQTSAEGKLDLFY